MGRCGYLQMGKRSQVAEGALGEAGDVVAVEGSEAEAQVRSAPVTGGNVRLSRCPWLGWCPFGFDGSPSGGSRGPSSIPAPSWQMCEHLPRPAQLGSRGVVGRGFGKERVNF